MLGLARIVANGSLVLIDFVNQAEAGVEPEDSMRRARNRTAIWFTSGTQGEQETQ